VSGGGLNSLVFPDLPHQACGAATRRLDVASRQTFSAETVMWWIFAVVALGLLMTALTVVELAWPVRSMTVGDRLIAVFVLTTCILAIVSGLVLLAAQTIP